MATAGAQPSGSWKRVPWHRMPEGPATRFPDGMSRATRHPGAGPRSRYRLAGLFWSRDPCPARSAAYAATSRFQL
jgi:hypothetical protein